MPHLKAEDRGRGHFQVAKGLTPSLIPIIFGLVLDATTASLGLGAGVPASASAAGLKVTLEMERCRRRSPASRYGG